jgi:hypothetical protein
MSGNAIVKCISISGVKPQGKFAGQAGPVKSACHSSALFYRYAVDEFQNVETISEYNDFSGVKPRNK